MNRYGNLAIVVFSLIILVIISSCAEGPMLKTQKLKIEDCFLKNSTDEKIDCLVLVSITNADRYACDWIGGNTSEENILMQKCYARLGKERMDYTICVEEVKIQPERADCIETVAIHEKNFDICSNIIDNEHLTRGSCEMKVALDLNNINKCREIVDDSFRNKCITKMAKYYKRSDYCDYLRLQSLKEECLAQS